MNQMGVFRIHEPGCYGVIVRREGDRYDCQINLPRSACVPHYLRHGLYAQSAAQVLAWLHNCAYAFASARDDQARQAGERP